MYTGRMLASFVYQHPTGRVFGVEMISGEVLEPMFKSTQETMPSVAVEFRTCVVLW